MSKNNNFIFHYAIFLFSSIGIFLTYRMHKLYSLNQECGTGNCNEIFNEVTFFGISNIYLGMAHYSILTTIGLSCIYLKKPIIKAIIPIRTLMIIIGFIYSIYLMSYIIFTDVGFCELCFYSACISTILFLFTIRLGFKNTSFKQSEFFKYLYISTVLIMTLLITTHKPNIQPSFKNKTTNMATYDIPISGSVVLGNPNAKVTITEFTDFQ